MDTHWPQTWPQPAEELHIFDPRGDVLLILERHLPVEEDPPECMDSEPTVGEPITEESALEEPVPEEPDLDWLQPEPLAEEPVPYEPDTLIAKAEDGQENDSTRSGSRAGSISTASCMMKPGIQEVQMRVSSRHLILASAAFSYLGSDTFPEGRTLQKEGSVVVRLADEDIDAMIILLHIVHGRTRKVPRQVSLKMLSKLAFVVNHRQMHEAVEFFSDCWIENLKQHPLPYSYTPKVLLWLFISWVFQKGDVFRNMSQILEQEGDDCLEDQADAGPPIPASIIKTIQQKRLFCIESTIQIIYNLIIKYSGTDIICCNDDRFMCDAALLGSLLKSSTAIGISPRPKNPYPGMTFKRLAEQIREMQILDNCRYLKSSKRGAFYASRSHGIKDWIEASLSSLADQLDGLRLESFLPQKIQEILNDDFLVANC